jgi:hypothetical protein
MTSTHSAGVTQLTQRDTNPLFSSESRFVSAESAVSTAGRHSVASLEPDAVEKAIAVLRIRLPIGRNPPVREPLTSPTAPTGRARLPTPKESNQ